MNNKIVDLKVNQVNELVDKFKKAKTIVAFDYNGLSVFDFTRLRGDLRKSQVEIKVYKNNISRRAAVASGYEEFAATLTGAKAIAFSYEDVVAPAKVVHEFARTNKNVVIKSGVIEGKDASLEKILALATLPSREGLLTQLAVGLLTPIREIAVGLNMLVENK